MKHSRIVELHAILKNPAASVEQKADAILEACREHHDGAEKRQLLCSVLDGFVVPAERRN